MVIATQQPPISIGVCSDTHFWFGGTNHQGESLQLQGHSELLLESLLSELRDANLDIAIHLGDMISGGGTFQMSSADFRNSLQRAATDLQDLPMDVFALPGNHDCVVGDAWSDFGRLWSMERGEGRTVDTEHARLVLLNTQGHSDEQIAMAMPADPVYGWISDDELGRLEDALATAGDRPVILFTHQLLIPWSSNQTWRDFYGVRNAEPILDLMKEFGNVRAVFQGHAHRYDIQTLNLSYEVEASAEGGNCTFVVLPSLIEFPLAWLKLTVSNNSIDVALQCLPLEKLAEASRVSGEGQEWRINRRKWRNFTINLPLRQPTISQPMIPESMISQPAISQPTISKY